MDPLVSVDWLAAHLHDADVVVADATLPPVGVTPVVDTQARYLAGHIPGAVFFDIDALSDHATSLPHMLPKPENFAESMAALGIGSEMTVVVYEQVGVFSAPRAWWMLRTMGAPKVYVLDGGLPAWTAAGHALETGPVQRARAHFAPAYDAGAVRDFAQLQEVLQGQEPGQVPEQVPEQVVDARSAGRFTGAAPEPRAGLRSGHMPGARSVPFTELVADGRLKEPEELRAAFTAKGVNLSQPITTTCGSGVTAAVLALGLERCGVRGVRLYDGSWAEYAQHPEARIETGS